MGDGNRRRSSGYRQVRGGLFLIIFINVKRSFLQIETSVQCDAFNIPQSSMVDELRVHDQGGQTRCF